MIELAASGYAVYQMMQKKVPGLIGFKPEKSKVSRASGIVPWWRQATSICPLAPWLDAFLNGLSVSGFQE